MPRPDLGLPGRAPPRARGGCRRVSLIVFLFAVGALVALGAIVFLYLRRQDEARAQFEPPIVLVTRPVSGSSATTGSYLPVSASAFGRRPIKRTELWVDGELKETQNSDQPEGFSTFNAQFIPAVPSEGPHMLFVRAVNIDGVVGQSPPVTFISGPKPGPGQLVYAVHVGTNETLASIGSLYGTDPATLQKVNPNLKGQEPAAGSMITVPIPSDGGSQASSSPPPLAPPGSAPVPIPSIPPLKIINPPFHVEGVLVGPANPPAAPDGLKAQVKDCKVTLVWNDNATNEDHYEIRMAGLNTPPRTIATLAPAAGGPAWFEFPAPQPGWFSFWLEAVNNLSRQPSNIVWVQIDLQCPTTLATHLQVQGLDMNVGVNSDRGYCYVSLESAPERRLPADSNAFIKVQAGKGDIATWASGANGLVVPIPADGDLGISGECWGWSGKELSKLGSFSSNYTADTWNGAGQQLEGGAFQVGISIKPLGAMDTTGTPVAYSFEDPSLLVPYDVYEDTMRSIWVNTDPLTRWLSWKWDGDQSKLTGFQIYFNGVPYNLGWSATPPLVVPTARGVEVRLPHNCGDHVRWQVVAVAGDAQSRLSKPYEYDQDPCQLQAKVKFDKIHLERTADDVGPCDILESSFRIGVNEKATCFGQCGSCPWGPTIFDYFEKCNYGEVTSIYGVRCGEWGFSWLIGGDGDEFTVPINANDIHLHIQTLFWDDGGAEFGRHDVKLSYPSIEKARDELGCYKTFVSDPVSSRAAWSQLTYTVAVYPNKCREIPPAKGF